MFVTNEDLKLLKRIEQNITNGCSSVNQHKEFKKLIERLEHDMNNNGHVAKNKIAYMRSHGFPYYARSREVQEKHYARYIKEVEYYIEHGDENVAMGILKRIIQENNYSNKQIEYFIGTIPKEILERYNSYMNI